MSAACPRGGLPGARLALSSPRSTRWAAALAATAPSGYFEALPGRMRDRLEPRRAGARRLPAWTWAAAAALLLAVVTPLTLSKRSSLQMEPAPAREQPAAAPPPTLEAPALRQSAPSAAPTVEAPPAKLQKVVTPPAAPPAVTVPSRPAANAAPSSDERSKRSKGRRRAHGRDRVSRPEPAAEGRRDGARRRAGPCPGALARGAAGATPAMRLPPRRSRPTKALRKASAPELKAADAIANADSRQRRRERVRPAERGRRGPPGARLRTPRRDAAVDEERRRSRLRGPTGREWRRLREELRRFADAAPAGPHADAARCVPSRSATRPGARAATRVTKAAARRYGAAYLERGEDAKNKRACAGCCAESPGRNASIQDLTLLSAAGCGDPRRRSQIATPSTIQTNKAPGRLRQPEHHTTHIAQERGHQPHESDANGFAAAGPGSAASTPRQTTKKANSVPMFVRS